MSHDEAVGEAKMTKRLYLDDPYRVDFEASVLKKTVLEGRPGLVLDQTCFYPESGGQPSDRGLIKGVEVVDVREIGEEILHVLATDISAEKVEGEVDWGRRFDHMQHHSGQHILSQSFLEVLRGETLSFHLGEEVSTVEIGLSRVGEEDVDGVERRANEIVFQDREIRTYWVDESNIGSIPLRKPPQKRGSIKVVEVAGFDHSACGGTHCRRTGEVGLIKITGWERIRGNLRFEFLCGERALRDYVRKNRTLRGLAGKLSSSEEGITSAVDKALQEIKSLKRSLKGLREALADYEAREVVRRAPGRVVNDVLNDKTKEEAKLLALNIIKAGEFVVLFGVRGEEKDHLVLARSENIAIDLRELIPLILSKVQGKGGGSASLVELVLEQSPGLEEIISKIAGEVRERGAA